MKRVLVFQDDLKISNSLDLLEVARRIYEDEPGESYESYGVFINRSFGEIQHFFHHIIKIQAGQVEEHDLIGLTDILEELHEKYQFDAILLPATPFCRMLASRLAMRIHTGLIADIVDIRKEEGHLKFVRPAFCGRILATMTCRGQGPIMLTVRPNAFSFNRTEASETHIIDYSPKEKKKNLIKCLEKKEKKKSYDIRESEILISGGGGIGSNLAQLDELAEELKGKVSASRRVVDAGIAPRAIQVGQSGKTVSPKLYIALGISGVMQHIVGLKNIENIISVNTDRYAPICSLSDIVVEGDALEFVSKLVKRIQSYKRDRGEKDNECD